MPETRYNIELRHGIHDRRWWYLVQSSNLNHAINIATRYSGIKEVRIRKVIKTIVWKNGKKYE